MESKKMEFDSTLGGNEQLPYSVNSLKFAASRSVEIAAMTESILHPSKTKLIFQNLPVHMRRRVMSHNAKRLPRLLRAGHLEQLKKSGLPPKQKRPSRKYRRRPGNLSEEYMRRQHKHVWLETHIWHAKRFHMIERWGHKLAYAPCDKAFRACYRASSAHCLINDISYYTAIKISGPEINIKQMFSSITNSKCGLGVGAKAYFDGKREGLIHLYRNNTYPYGYIGKAQFIWDINKLDKCLWLFVHPSQVKQIESLLADLLCSKTNNMEIAGKKRKLCNNYSEHIQYKLFPGSFNRFSLTGPKSHTVLVNALKCIEDVENIKGNKWLSMVDIDNLHLTEKKTYWDNIKEASSTSQLSPKLVIGLVVKDPRLSRPKYRTKAISDSSEAINIEALLNIPNNISTSNLWQTNIHDVIKKEKLSNTQYINHVTKTQLVPGEVNINDPALQSVPIVLIQKPGSQDPCVKKTGYGSGWDIIIPPGYGMQFWQTFIMFGARAGGLREIENIHFESGQCYLTPDSDAGREEEIRIANTRKERFFKLPPSKRVNYLKLGIVTPFTSPWKTLLQEWGDKVEDFYILRDRQILSNIQECLSKMIQLPAIENASSCLIAINLKMIKEGSLKQNAIICMPKADDVKTIRTLFEPQHEDMNEKLRKQKRAEHKSQIKQKRRQRAKLKKLGSMIQPASKLEKGIPSDYVKAMRELWVPSDIKTVRHSCSREIMGFVSQAAFSFSEARSCGIGYIPYNALYALLKNKHNTVLVRNTTSRKYRLANVGIIIH